MTCCNVIIPITKYPYVYYLWQSVRGDSEHFDIFVISWQFEHFWANNWQGIINNSHKTIKLWFNEEKLFHLIFTTYQNYPLALRLKHTTKKKGLQSIKRTHTKKDYTVQPWLSGHQLSGYLCYPAAISQCTCILSFLLLISIYDLAQNKNGMVDFFYFIFFFQIIKDNSCCYKCSTINECIIECIDPPELTVFLLTVVAQWIRPRTTDSQSWVSRFESAGSGSRALGQGTLFSLPSPSERT